MQPHTTIVVPLVGPIADPDRVSEQALPVARALAERTTGLVVLVSVMEFMEEFSDLPQSELDDPEVIAGRTDSRDSYLRNVGTLFGNLPVHTEVLQGGAADGILSLARSLDNPVVVMASHGHTGMRRMVLGSVAFDVIQRATFPVLVVPTRDVIDDAPPRPDTLERLLIPLDRSAESEQAVDAALAALGGRSMAVRLVHVVNPLAQRSSRHAARYYETAKAVGRQYLAGIEERLRVSGHDVTTAVVVGPTRDEVARQAREFNADLIVMATHGRSGISRMLLGSVTEGLVQSGARPILVVPPRMAISSVAALATQHEPSGTDDVDVRLALRGARDIMVSPAITVREHTTVEEVANTMLDHRIGCVPVVDENDTLRGVITHSDFTGEERCPPFSVYRTPQLFGKWVPRAGIERIYEAGRTLRAEQIMSAPVVSVTADESVASIVDKMVHHDITSLPVVDEGRVIGIVTRHDLLKMLS